MIWYFLLLVLVVVPLAVSATRPVTGTSAAWVGGMVLFYVAQRPLEGADQAVWFTGAALLMLVAAFAMRLRAMAGSDREIAATQRAALIAQLVATSALLVYGFTTDSVVASLGLGEEAASRWTVAFGAVWPILCIAGALPMMLLDLVLGNNPVKLPSGARTQAVQSGLALAFGISLIFPINYLADAHDIDADFSYFRVTRPGSSTEALVRNLEQPVEVMLFYPPGNDVKEKLVPYFSHLQDRSDGKLTLKVIDQAMSPILAKELAVRDNGYIVLRSGDSKKKFKIDTELRRARSALKTLDGTFQKHLLELSKGKRIAYMLTGHGEASARGNEDEFKLGEFKRILRDQNYEVKDFGIESGSTTGVPDDAAMVILAAPERTMLPEEAKTLGRYVDAGGALLVYADPGRDRMTDLMSHIGITIGEHPLANATKYAVKSGGVVDRANLATNRYGSHPAVSTLSKFASRAGMIFLTTAALNETTGATAPGPAKYTPLVRSFDDTWEDADGDYEPSAGEAKKTHVLAMAVEGPEAHPYRVIVVGDVTSASDFLTKRFAGNFQFILDASRWLIGDEDLAGEVNNEEDVRIEHTREEDTIWFYSLIFGIPFLVLAAGAVVTTRRRRKGR